MIDYLMSDNSSGDLGIMFKLNFLEKLQIIGFDFRITILTI